MKKKGIFRYVAFCFTLLLLLVPDICVGWEIMDYYFPLDDSPRNQYYPWIEYNPVDNEFMGVWRTSGRLRDDCDPSDEYECSHSFHTIDGRRASSDGALPGELFQLSPPEQGWKMVPRCAHNIFTNEYLVAFTTGTEGHTNENIPNARMDIVIMDNVGNIRYGPRHLLDEGGGAMLPVVVFNPVEREYLVVYNDSKIFSDYKNNVGFILDENGNTIKGPFLVGSSQSLTGDQYAPLAAYNSAENTYFIVWEDFRHVANWMEPCDIYGGLFDADGNMIFEVTILDDHDKEGGGDQRVPNVAYNSHKNEYLVVWEDPAPPIDNKGINGVIVNADGTLAGPVFVVEDHHRIQHWPSLVYIEEEKKYFISWTDTRNDGLPADDPWFFSENMDIYGRWLDDTGNPVGEEIELCLEEGNQSSGVVSYNPLMKRIMVAWYDRNAPGDYSSISTDPDDLWAETPGNVTATLYGKPSFLTAHVVAKKTGVPVKGAIALVIGPTLPIVEKTNEYGWFNIVENSHPSGIYLVMAFKLGYPVSFQLVNYTGEPLDVTIEMNKWW